MSNSTKHTPGPWKRRIADSVGTDYMMVASVYPMEDEDAQTLSANVALISAAPDLLVALQACLAYLENDVPLPNYCDAEKRVARAAIAKAMGVAS